MMLNNGYFVISLDYELHWGIFDHTRVEEYKENLDHVSEVIDSLLKLSEIYQVHITFATVGFLFAKNKNELLVFTPSKKPSYDNQQLNPYLLFDKIGNSSADDPYHYSKDMIQKICDTEFHEIGTHTFSHYYCLEKGQTEAEFSADIKAGIAIAKNMGISIESIVFPRNQVEDRYLKICFQNGIKSYRGTEKSFMYRSVSSNEKIPLSRVLRLLDTYINITGHNTYVPTLDIENILNLPSSRFLRPYNTTLRPFEKWKEKRIINSMQHAAKNKEVYHLWWHPHNSGKNRQQNLDQIERIFAAYHKLHKDYHFESITMTGLTNLLKK